MKHTSTPTFVLTLPLKTTRTDVEQLNKAFRIGCRIYNILVKEARRRINNYFQDDTVKALFVEYKQTREYSKEEKAQLQQLRNQYGLTGSYFLDEYIKPLKKKYKKYIPSHVANSLYENVWKSVEKFLFSNGNKLHFKKLDNFRSLKGKTNDSCIRLRNDIVCFNGLRLPIIVRTQYEALSLQNRIKYCSIVRRWNKTDWKYYVQIALEGVPPYKANTDGVVSNALGIGMCGIDIGPSTIAVSSQSGLVFQELADTITPVEREISRLNRKRNRQRRANNPDNFDEKGRI